MPDSIMDSVTSVQENIDYFKCLLYGVPGSGKTKLACEAPNALLLDTEHGSRTLKNHPELSGVKVLKIKSVKDLSDVFWELKDGGFPEYKTVIVDTLSELQKRALDEALKKNSATNPKLDPYVPAGTDYQRNTEQIRRLVMSYRDLDRNIIFTAHEVEEKDDSDGIIKVRPALTPKVNQTVYGLMDLIGYLTITFNAEGKAERKLQVHPSRRVQAKTRLELPPIITNPTMKFLLDANKGTTLVAQAKGA